VTAELATVLADYRTGLDTELQILSALEDTAIRQRALPHRASADDLGALAGIRQQQLTALRTLDQHLLPLRQRIADDLDAARQLPGFAGIVERHHRMQALIASITRLDDESLEVLKQAEEERRAAAHSLDTGEATLAAYRRLLQQPQPSAGLFTQRG
jgi:hypothetical protein